MTRVIPTQTIIEDQGFTMRARFVHEDGLVVLPSEIQSWDVRIYETGSGADTQVKADIGKDPSIAMTALASWARDPIGHNFSFKVPYNYWDMQGGKVYRIEITLWKVDGEPIRYIHRVHIANVIGV